MTNDRQSTLIDVTTESLGKRSSLIKQITENQLIAGDKISEAQSYPPLRTLLTDTRIGTGIPAHCVLTDAPVPSGSERPDFQIWLEGVPVELRNENEHLYAIIEVKSGSKVRDGAKAYANREIKRKGYWYTRLAHFWLLDAYVVARYDLEGAEELPDPIVWNWSDLAHDDKFKECFRPLFAERRTLRGMLQTFSEVEIPVGKTVTDKRRNEFIRSVITVARLLSRGVSEIVQARLIPDLRQAMELISPMSVRYGDPVYDWSLGNEYLIFPNEPAPSNISDYHQFNQEYTQLIEDLTPFEYALRAEKEHLVSYAKRSGLNQKEASFFKSTKDAKSARESFIQETATLLFSRLTMIRFSEDHGLLPRYISNGGLKTFMQYSRHFKQPFQKLVRDAYENARPLYRHLFERKSLDWIIERPDPKLGDELLHAMWILARWDFKTVRGDILSGVYDKYLNSSQRKQLGEVYTRPELARYMLKACGWDGSQTIFDPACGSGTFLVEAFDMVLRRQENSGLVFDEQDALGLIRRIFGLDLNEFSATLAKIQLLWHLLSVITNHPEQVMREAIQSIKIEGGHDSLDTWGTPMIKRNDLFYNSDIMRIAKERDEASDTRRRRTIKASARRYRDISTRHEGYDIVVGNPPYVRIHRIAMDEQIKFDYEEVAFKQTDLSAFFVYRTLKWWLKPGGRMAMFLPMATTEAAYTEKLRRMVQEYKIVEIVDLELLGNSTFHGANVVTVILVVEKTPASAKDLVRITTVTQECFDDKTNTIDMGLAQSLNIPREHIVLERYLPQTDVLSDEEFEDEETVDTAWLTKIKPADVPILEQLTRTRRLDSLIQRGYEKRRRGKIVQRELSIPPDANPMEWKEKRMMGYGVKIGGTPPNQPEGLPILKGGDTFPDGIDGDPIGFWDGSKDLVDTVRFYGWKEYMDTSRCFGLRELSLVPVVGPHPKNAYLQNTVYLVQLAEVFPLNIYTVSRIVSWFMVKTARASVMSGSMRAHWFPRNILRIPVPTEMSYGLNQELVQIGARIFELDRELASGDRQVDEFSNTENGKSKPLKQRTDLLTEGEISRPTDVAWPDKEMDWSGTEAIEIEDRILFAMPSPLFPEYPSPTSDGRPCEFVVRDAKLRRWLLWQCNALLEGGRLPSASWLSNIAIPDDIDVAMTVLDRLENHQAEIDLENAISRLDIVVAKALGLTESQRDYIIDEMQLDPLLSLLHPAWRHKVRRKRLYKAYGGVWRY